MTALDTNKQIAVIGAGTMGAGIAQVAAAAGHNVILFDVAEGAAQKGLDGVAKGLAKLVERGKKTQDDVDALCARITATENFDDMAKSALVIEAIVENLDIKRKVLANLEALCDEKAIFASNTSSISISALAAEMQHPQRLVGMHFFNPAPILKLVEVISGLQTEASVAETIYDTAKAWGKLPVHAKSSPGFIVNRVARPFYAEALRSLNEQVATVPTVDAIMRGAGGFKMGPLELTDLIGQDINNAVTQSVYSAYYGDKRFQPSTVQREIVDAGLLGRKSGRGFYDYAKDAEQPQADTVAEQNKPTSITVYGDLASAAALAGMAEQAGINVEQKKSDEAYIAIGNTRLQLSDGRLACELAAQTGENNIVLFDLALDYQQASHIAISLAAQTDDKALANAAGFFQALGKQVSVIKDVPGMQVMRTVCMLVNEGADAVNQGVCDAEAVDIAMQAGVAYPKGPMAWGQQIGVTHVVTVLQNMQRLYGEERYRCSPLLLTANYANKAII